MTSFHFPIANYFNFLLFPSVEVPGGCCNLHGVSSIGGKEITERFKFSIVLNDDVH